MARHIKDTPLFLVQGERICTSREVNLLKPYKAKKDQYRDAPTYIDVKESILQLRRIYHELNDEEFARMYQKRYKIKKAIVLKVMQRGVSRNGIQGGGTQN